MPIAITSKPTRNGKRSITPWRVEKGLEIR